MHAQAIVMSSNDKVLQLIVTCISGIECSRFFSNHLDRTQSEQNCVVRAFQEIARLALADAVPDIEWKTEHCPNSHNRDRIDIFGQGAEFVVVIELDKARADQVAKKFLSRLAMLPPTKLYFLSLCYPGTKRMNERECKKYLAYCSELASRTRNHYAGLIIDQPP
ncbi:MAG: PD-(D/E)XK nuclease family protein [Planctomycetia bacterium]|jgi:hypothetical protein|nr:PD-(D/E)XK nuclease family protein [Planctomycetia bacterium]